MTTHVTSDFCKALVIAEAERHCKTTVRSRTVARGSRCNYCGGGSSDSGSPGAGAGTGTGDATAGKRTGYDCGGWWVVVQVRSGHECNDFCPLTGVPFQMDGTASPLRYPKGNPHSVETRRSAYSVPATKQTDRLTDIAQKEGRSFRTKNLEENNRCDAVSYTTIEVLNGVCITGNYLQCDICANID